MAVNCLLQRIGTDLGAVDGVFRLICQECKEPLLPGQAIQFDHIHQHATGGAHTYQALRPIHYDPCHKAKNKRDARARRKIRDLTGQNKPKPKRSWPEGRKLQGKGFQKKRKDT